MLKSCNNCDFFKFWKPRTSETGTCQLNPPIQVTGYQEGEIDFMQPETLANSRCSYWQKCEKPSDDK